MRPWIYFDERHQRCDDPDEAATDGYGPPCSATSFNRGEKFAGIAVVPSRKWLKFRVV